MTSAPEQKPVEQSEAAAAELHKAGTSPKMLYMGSTVVVAASLHFAGQCTMQASAVILLVFLLLGKYIFNDSRIKEKKIALALLQLQAGNYEQARISPDDPDLDDALKSLAASLAELDRGQRKWVADTSHELRTPIAVLRAQVEAFQDGVQQVTPRNLEVLHSEIMALSKLVDDLHWLAKNDVGQIKPAAVPVDINQSLQDVLESFEERRAAKAINLENKVPKETKIVVNADASRIRQVLTNVIENSLRYTNKGGTLKIAHQISESEVKLFFDDTEPGVEPEILPKIFDRFYRAESSRSRTLGGSGLGLAICLNNMQLLGGTIEARPSDMGGLQIILTLPAMAETK
ncbi:MAG: hypothetical protein JSS86_00930 [Cyanobacteria bacterium SZAS LIN-2]|nr:hypothetical protein [Cyanobacteria bacterium SZAS LIN-3]MBS1994834.1 hypothetical protein [Cyanobacteria bacterium SZAS LIN-2]